MTYTLNRDKSAAVAIDYFWQGLGSCPLGVRILGLSEQGVARIDVWSGKKTDLVAWAPLPKRPAWMTMEKES